MHKWMIAITVCLLMAGLLLSCDRREIETSGESTTEPTSSGSTSPTNNESAVPTTSEYAGLYYVRDAWALPETQSGAFESYENAVKHAESTGQSVFDNSGETLFVAPSLAVTPTAVPVLYYVRRDWGDTGSQVGAFASYENAKKAADQAGITVFDADGKRLYTAERQAFDRSSFSSVKYGWTYPASADTIATLRKYNAHARVDTDEQIVYLTFNAGYEHNGNAGKILQILNAKGVKASFFFDGYFLRSNPELVRQMVASQHVVANHTLSHADLIALLQTGQIEAAARELEAFDDLYESIVGSRPPMIFRPPSSDWSEQVLAFAQYQGYVTYFFNWTHRDWLVNEQPDADTTYQQLIRQLSPGNIIMLHSVSDTNVAILERFLTEANRAGYRFEVLPR